MDGCGNGMWQLVVRATVFAIVLVLGTVILLLHIMQFHRG